MKENTVRPDLNNPETKARFAFQYYGQPVFRLDGLSNLKTKPFDNMMECDYLELTPVDQITDEHIIHIARLAHQRPSHIFRIERKSDIIYAKTDYDSTGIQYFISIMPQYGTVCATMNFAKTEKSDFKRYTVNIGKINLCASRPVPYIAIADFFRSNGYAIGWRDYSVRELIAAGYMQLRKGGEGE